MRRWLVGGVFAGLAGAGAVWAAGSVLTAPALRAVEAPPDLPVEPFPIASAQTLAGWALPTDSARGVVVLMHGVRADRGAQVGRLRLFHAMGYHVVAFDFQAHGESPGDAITFGARESADAVAAVRAARSRWPGLPVAVVAQSMGGAAAILAGPALGADALVVEAVYASLDRATRNRLALRLGRAGAALAPLLTAQAGVRLGLSLDDLRPAVAVARVAAPVFVIGGTADRHAHPDETRAIYDAAPAPKRLWLVDGAAHEDFSAAAPERYRQRVGAFLDRHLGE